MTFVKKELTSAFQDAIAEFLESGGKIKSCPPVAAPGNEMSRATRDLVRKARSEYRRNEKKG